jgi:20S proteasome subunit alpha 6
MPLTGSLEDLIKHGLHALRETLQQDKELTVKNTTIGIVGPAGAHETSVTSEGSFRIKEDESIKVYLQSMVPKEPAEAPVAAPPPSTGDDDVQMADQ